MKIFKGDDFIHPDYYHRGGIDVIKFVELFLGKQLIEFHRRMAEEHLRRLIEMEERSE